MEDMAYTCPDCGRVEVLDTREIPEDELLKLDVVFKDWMVGMGWRLVRCGLFGMSRKWVCDKCEKHYA